LCGKDKADYTARNIGCWACIPAAYEPGEYLRALAVEVGAPGGGALLEDPHRYLAHLATGPPRRSRPAELPSAAMRKGQHERLLSNRVALRYLRKERGLSLATIRRYRLGYDGEAITIPVWHDGEVVNVRRRFLDPDADPKILGLAGRPAELYPAPPEGRAWLLGEGEWDVLLALQKGLPAVTSTAGAHWSSEWDALVVGKRIAVVYDVGSLAAATRRAAELRAAGAAEAWPVDLGLAHGEDLTDWFVKYGRSAERLKRLIRRERGQQ